MDGSHVETEVKIRVSDPEAARTLLAHHGYSVLRPRLLESNVLYDTKDRALEKRGELVRVRRSGDEGVLTFKSRGAPGRHKSREELETMVSQAGVMETILVRLGLTPAFRYEKYRTEYQRGSEPGIVTLDETPIGTFLELEGTPAWIDAAARQLTFSESDYIVKSYGTLYADHCSRAGVAPTNMLFAPKRDAP